MTNYNVPDKKLDRLFSCLLTTNMRITQPISQLKSLIPVVKQTQKSKINRKYLSTLFFQERDLMKIFKLSVLLNQSILEGYVPDANILVSLLITNITKFNHSTSTKTNYIFIMERIVSPYLHYLQKRINFEDERQMKVGADIKSMKSMGCKMLKSRFNSQNMVASGHRGEMFVKVYTEIEKCYNIINLLRKIDYFWADAIKMFRYFGGYYGFTVDFNIVIGHDVRVLYEEMKVIFFSFVQCLQYQPSVKLIGQVQKLTKEIEKINQGCEHIYYNAYNCNELKKLAPKLIDSELYFDMAFNIQRLRKKQKDNPRILYESDSLFSLKESQSTFFQTTISQNWTALSRNPHQQVIIDKLTDQIEEDSFNINKQLNFESTQITHEDAKNTRKIENCRILEEMEKILFNISQNVDLRSTADSLKNC